MHILDIEDDKKLKNQSKEELLMGDYETSGKGHGLLSPTTLFLILILLLTGTLGGKRHYNE